MQFRLASLRSIALQTEPMPVPLFPPEPVFGAITLGTDFVQEYLPLVLPSPVLAARFLSRVSIQDLSIGLAVLVLGFAAGIVSAATLHAPVAAYLVVNKSPDAQGTVVGTFLIPCVV